MSFNILSKSLQDTTTLHLVDPETGEEMYDGEDMSKPLTIELFGKSSKQHQKWLSAAMRKSELEQKAKKKTKTAEELLAENAEFFATMTKAINNIDLDGEPLDNKEAFKKLYGNPALLWINEQVAEKLGETASFFSK